MFVENQNYADSLLFLGSARIALSNIVKESGVSSKNKLSSYLRKEATDYEIMHLLVRESMPNKRFNVIDEAELWKEFKIKLIANHSIVKEAIGGKVFANVLTEVDSIYPLQSAETLYEYSMQLFKEDFIQEGPWDTIWRMIRTGGKAEDINKVVSQAKNVVARGGTAEDIKKMQQLGGELVKQGYEKAGQSLQRAAQQAGQGLGRVKAGVQAGAGAIADKAKELNKMGLRQDIRAKQAAMPASKRAAGEVIATAQQQAGGGGMGDKLLKGDISSRNVASDPQPIMARIRQAMDSARELPAKISKFAQSPAGLAVGGAALGALAIYGATKAYKRFFSQAAKACAGKSGGEKTRCMNAYKVQGLQKQMQDLKAGSSACKAAKNPDKCQGAITRKMASLQNQIGKLKARGV